MRPRYAREVQELLANLDKGNEENEPETEIPPSQETQEPLREIHVIFVREEDEDEQDVIDSTVSDMDTAPLTVRQHSATAGSGIVYFGLFIILITLSCIMFQIYEIVNPFTANVTLIARSQQLTLQGSLQLGRELNPTTLSQSQTVPTTGKGHQDARSATGELTFYNGQPAQQFVPAGTMLTGNDGVQVITDADATIPAAYPPVFGEVTVSAHASNTGKAGNIQALDMNTTINTVFVKNLSAFSGGQDERNFQTVAKSDIDNTASPLKATLAQSVQGALQGQLKQGEQLQTLPCRPTFISDHQPGQEATAVKVTASETCSAVAYNQDALEAKVSDLLNNQAATRLGSGYSLLETPQINITGATPARQVTLSFTTVSTWVYGISNAQQRHIKASIAGKNIQQALQILRSLPGIESPSLQFSGFGDASRVPKNIGSISLTILISAA